MISASNRSGSIIIIIYYLLGSRREFLRAMQSYAIVHPDFFFTQATKDVPTIIIIPAQYNKCRAWFSLTDDGNSTFLICVYLIYRFYLQFIQNCINIITCAKQNIRYNCSVISDDSDGRLGKVSIGSTMYNTVHDADIWPIIIAKIK